MKRLLFALFAGLVAQTAVAQFTCNATFSAAMAPQNNNLLRLQLNNNTTLPTTPSYMTYFNISWGDNSVTYGNTGNNYHNYSSPGVYTVKLLMSVYDSVGSSLVWICSDTETQNITVAHTTCATSFTTSVSGNVVTVTANNPGGSGTTYSWDWGDGTANGSGSPATHTYASGGTKQIKLTAVNGSCTYINSATVTVGNGSNCSNAIANFTSSANGLSVTFSASSSNISGTTKKYDWYYGDGNSLLNTGNGMPTHTYASAGSYTVTLFTKWRDSTTNVLYCTDSIIKTITVTSNITGKIDGHIEQDSSSTVAKVDSPQYKVWLIVYDSATSTLSAVDSVVVNGTNSYNTPYQFTGVSNGTYRVKAAMLNGPTSGSGWVPTYHYSSLMWNAATAFVYTGSTVYKTIIMKSGTVTSGPGFVAGNVNMGANKGSGTGVKGLTMILLDGNGNMVKNTVTDANGGYTFDQLVPGQYSVYPELLGFTTMPATITISNNKPVISGISFEISNTQKTITPVATAVSNVEANQFAVYPNPAKEKVTIQWTGTATDVDVVMTDITGKTVINTHVNTGNITELNLSSFEKGLYFISVHMNGQVQTHKIVLQ